MRKAFICLLLLISITAFGQNVLNLKVINKETKEPLAGVTIMSKGIKNLPPTDNAGIATIILPAGKLNIYLSHVSFKSQQIPLIIPFKDSLLTIEMEPNENEEEEVVIKSTRSTRTFRDIPTRVEFIAGEELDEKSNMKPGDIRMVLNESTGIQTQQTSATSANASIRIQGLDGRYTQILKDGLPLYAGFSSGLGLLQTPPLDLQQFEVIKGSASTLYGGGAIAGLVNLISKSPREKRELRFHIDATSAGGLNTSGFYGQKLGKVGMTLFASRNSNAAYDPADIGLTAIPKFERYTVNPRLFWFLNSTTEISVGANLTTEDRTGGDIEFIRGNKPSGFFEENNSDRISTQFSLEHKFGKCSHITLKNSINHFKRTMSLPGYVFDGKQNGTFTEAMYALHGDKIEWVTGLNFVTDNFSEVKTTTTPFRDYEQVTIGVFIQNNLKVNERFSLETGLRGDQVKDYGFAILPRLSALFKFNSNWSSRVGGGMGYKTPTIFSEESERLQYKNVLPVNTDSTSLERSYGVNADINFKTKFADGKISFSINQLFFYTRITDPLLLEPEGSNYRFNTVSGHIDSRGMETNIKIGYADFKLFLGYTLTNAYLHEVGLKTENFLTPKHRLNSVLLYELEEKWKIGLEAYYFSKQKLSDGTVGKPYWINGFMVEKLWEKFSLYINFENFLDTRQTKFGSIFTGSIENPVFKDIYAPLDGFVVNGGVKLRF